MCEEFFAHAGKTSIASEEPFGRGGKIYYVRKDLFGYVGITSGAPEELFGSGGNISGDKKAEKSVSLAINIH